MFFPCCSMQNRQNNGTFYRGQIMAKKEVSFPFAVIPANIVALKTSPADNAHFELLQLWQEMSNESVRAPDHKRGEIYAKYEALENAAIAKHGVIRLYAE